MSCILKFEYSKNYIDSELLPWKNNDKKDIINSTDIIEDYQVGTIIKHQKLIKIITPFFVYIPYAKCSILNTDHTLSLVSYCIYTRIAIYTTCNKNVKKYINSNQLNIFLDNITCCIYIELANKSFVDLALHISFENILNNNIYPFIWLKTKISETLKDDIIPGMHVHIRDKLIGIIYNCIDDQLYIIPNITLLLNLNTNRLSNVFFTMDNEQIIKNTYTSLLKPDDKIISINNKKLNTKSMIYFEKIKLYIPSNTYLWYYSMYNNLIKFNIIRDSKQLITNIKLYQLDKKISFGIESTTSFKIINNIIFAKSNLLMIEWLTHNDIIYRNEMYLNYMINPYYRYKNNYLFIGIIDIDQHPEQIKQKLNPYYKDITKYMDSMTIISINNKKKFNMNKLDSIINLVLSDPFNNVLVLDWCY